MVGDNDIAAIVLTTVAAGVAGAAGAAGAAAIVTFCR
jgi:hypothetical protein